MCGCVCGCVFCVNSRRHKTVWHFYHQSRVKVNLFSRANQNELSAESQRGLSPATAGNEKTQDREVLDGRLCEERQVDAEQGKGLSTSYTKRQENGGNMCKVCNQPARHEQK